MKNYLILFFISLLFCSCQYENIKESEVVKKLNSTKALDTVSFNIHGFNSGVTLALISDSTFFYKTEFWGCMGGGEETYVFGKYTQKKNLVTLLPGRIKSLAYWDEEDPFDYSKPEIKEYKFRKDSLDIKRSYYILEKNKKTYLLSPEFKEEFFPDVSKTNDFEDYAQMSKDKESYYGYFFMMDTIIFGDYGMNTLPEKYLRIIE